MLKTSLFAVYVFIKSLFCTCASDEKANDFAISKGKKGYKISRIDKLPKSVKESSALVVINKTSQETEFWTLQDGEGESVLYKVNTQGELLETLKIPNAKNVDWEALTMDKQGNFYIGDFGNNQNNRKDLRIYKYNPETNETSIIKFNYSDQEKFPPVRKNMNFDAEAFIWHSNSLFIFSKNRGDNLVKLYKLPDSPGEYPAEVIDEVYLSGMITDAGISPDSRTFALLSYGKIYLFGVEEGNLNLENPLRCIRFPRSGQSEGLGFTSDTDFLITNENRKIFYVKKKGSEHRIPVYWR